MAVVQCTDNYGREISLFSHLYDATKDKADLKTVLDLVDRGEHETLREQPAREHPAESYYRNN
jgi:hypothetical protein